ncbi:mating-type protein [Coprinopsis marcescibilis]|uniref:Mating-type protein n=1 Tax=Coprinopsis marcescibilis TaxID=230819 RepID=A0A5C3LFE9_COPMA|nr:mating-type protein [Coprinopsis marcescibilis]
MSPASDNLDMAARRSLESLRKDFFSLLRGESSAFGTFLSACSNLDTLIQSRPDSLKEDTIDALHELTLPISAVAPKLASLDAQKHAATNKFAADMMSILEDKTDKIKLSDDAASPPAYIQPSARWLKENLSNPYPSSQTRSEIARQTGTARKDVDAWFIDARKRIGWNDLRRKHFDNKRANIVEAASIFFTDKNDTSVEGSNSLSTAIELEFADVQARATSLYDKHFSKSGLAKKLDGAVIDMTPSLKEQLQAEREHLKRERKTKKPRYAYPTPERSPECFPETLSSPSPSSSVIDLTAPEQMPTRRKRRCSSPSIVEDAESSQRPSKRKRAQSPVRECSPLVGLPSPTLSIQEHFSETTKSPGTAPALPTLTKRKRRLSDGFQYPTAKRPNLRPQAVSDPLPHMSFEELDKLLLQFQSEHSSVLMPSPVSVDAPDPSTPLDIQLSNLPVIPDTFDFLPTTSDDSVSIPSLDVIQQTGPILSTPDADAWASPSLADQTNLCLQTLEPIYPSFDDFATLASQSEEQVQSFDISAPTSATFTMDYWTDFSIIPGMFAFTGLEQVASLEVPELQEPLGLPEVQGSAGQTLKEQQRDVKRRELEELEARARALRAEISEP